MLMLLVVFFWEMFCDEKFRDVFIHVGTSVVNAMQIPAGDVRWQYFIPRLVIEVNPNIDPQHP
jgi:hypothetical protein